MIPKKMESYLRERLPKRTWQNRLVRDQGLAYIEFSSVDIDRLARMEIEVDPLGPRLVVCMWDEVSPLEIGGYLVVDNLAMGKPSMGGIRMLSDVTPSIVHNLARGMTLKNAAANLPYGGGKSGIVANPDLAPDHHTAVVEGFARLLHRYHDIYLPGPDVGTNDADMKTVAIVNGLDNALSKPVDMGGNRIDQLGAAAGGVIIALDALMMEMPRLQALPQFCNFVLPETDQLTALIQGFGAVGAHAAQFLCRQFPHAQVIGISDEFGYLYAESGIPVEELFKMWETQQRVTKTFFEDQIASEESRSAQVKYSNAPNDLLRESAFCLIPAAPIANYLDLDTSSNPCMTVDRMGHWSLIIEGANTYSPDPERKAARAKMEREVYRRQGVFIATDYLVNSGGVIFAAQEHLIKTPDDIRIPTEMLGDRQRVNQWLIDHARAFEQLAESRRIAAEKYRDQVIRRNMQELVDLLISDADMLPYEAAERISIRRIAARESDRIAADIMAPIPIAPMDSPLQRAAQLLIETRSSILAVVNSSGELAGVVTEWDITQAVSLGCEQDMLISEIMTQEVISAQPDEAILELVRKLEQHEISAMPVVDDGEVMGMVSSDLLARRSLLRLLQSQAA